MDEIKFRKGKPPGIHSDLSAEEILNALEGIRQANDGRLTALAVLKAATPKRSLLHGVFEWDDTKAAQHHRMSQARVLIRSIVIVRDEQAPIPAYLNVIVQKEDEESKRYYQHADVIVEQHDEFISAIRLLKRKVLEAEESLSSASRIGAHHKRTDVDMQLLVGIGEALATARAMVDRLQ